MAPELEPGLRWQVLDRLLLAGCEDTHSPLFRPTLRCVCVLCEQVQGTKHKSVHMRLLHKSVSPWRGPMWAGVQLSWRPLALHRSASQKTRFP